MLRFPVDVPSSCTPFLPCLCLTHYHRLFSSFPRSAHSLSSYVAIHVLFRASRASSLCLLFAEPVGSLSFVQQHICWGANATHICHHAIQSLCSRYHPQPCADKCPFPCSTHLAFFPVLT